MKKFGIFILALLFFSAKLCANPENFDIFGVDENTKQKIYSCCSKIFQQYLSESNKVNISKTPPSEEDMIHMLKFENKIISKIRQEGDFSEVKLSSVYYPFDHKTFCTLDIVKEGDASRIPAKKRVIRNSKILRSKGVKKLFKIWNDYDEKNIRLIRANKLDLSKTSCPALHCTWGFDENGIKTIFPKLQKAVIQNKKELFNIIENSSDDTERANAIFILANGNHYQETVDFLINYTDDPSDLVRNNVMRVIGAIVAKHKVQNIKLEKITQALNYPYVTDRNKAAYVLLGIVKSNTAIHGRVIKQSGNTLLELLKLQQPNNHDFAYQILKELSHKNYDEHDYASWSKWIKEQQSGHNL